MAERIANYEVGYQVAVQRRFRVAMECADGRRVTVTLSASSIESVIDQVKGRRIATPGDMKSFTVSEVTGP